MSIRPSDRSEQDWKRLRKWAENYAKRRGYPKLAEDFASYYSQELLARDEGHFAIRFAFGSYLREAIYDYRLKAPPPIFIEFNEEYGDSHVPIIDDEQKICLERYAKLLEKKEIPYYYLFYQWGFNVEELSRVFDICESRIRQILKKIREKLKE